MNKNSNHSHWENNIYSCLGSPIFIPPYKIIKSLTIAKKNQFSQLIDLFATDYPEKKERFEITYVLLSIKRKSRMFLKTSINEHQSVESATELYKCSAWLEREAHDMYGIQFHGNTDLRTLLLDYNFKGYPMRKDFPLSGYKEVRYDINSKQVEYADLDLSQEYRDFDFISPWFDKGAT